MNRLAAFSICILALLGSFAQSATGQCLLHADGEISGFINGVPVAATVSVMGDTCTGLDEIDLGSVDISERALIDPWHTPCMIFGDPQGGQTRLPLSITDGNYLEVYEVDFSTGEHLNIETTAIRLDSTHFHTSMVYSGSVPTRSDVHCLDYANRLTQVNDTTLRYDIEQVFRAGREIIRASGVAHIYYHTGYDLLSPWNFSIEVTGHHSMYNENSQELQVHHQMVVYPGSCHSMYDLTAPGQLDADFEDANDDQCDLKSGRDVIVDVIIPHSGYWNFSLCGGTWDSHLFITVSCCLGVINSDNDGCGQVQGPSAVSCQQLPAGNYYIVIEPATPDPHPEYRPFSLTVTECLPCAVCHPSDVEEYSESQDSLAWWDYNAGCFGAREFFQQLDCGDTVCGIGITYDGFDGIPRWDSDMYLLPISCQRTVIWTVVADFPFYSGIFDVSDCGSYDTLAFGTRQQPCSSLSITAANLMPGGSYALFFAPVSTMGLGHYRAWTSCTPACAAPSAPDSLTIQSSQEALGQAVELRWPTSAEGTIPVGYRVVAQSGGPTHTLALPPVSVYENPHISFIELIGGDPQESFIVTAVSDLPHAHGRLLMDPAETCDTVFVPVDGANGDSSLVLEVAIVPPRSEAPILSPFSYSSTLQVGNVSHTYCFDNSDLLLIGLILLALEPAPGHPHGPGDTFQYTGYWEGANHQVLAQCERTIVLVPANGDSLQSTPDPVRD